GRELDAAGGDLQRLGERFYQLRFSEAGQSFEENMAAGENAGEHVLDERFLSEDDVVEGFLEAFERAIDGGYFLFGRVWRRHEVGERVEVRSGEWILIEVSLQAFALGGCQ